MKNLLLLIIFAAMVVLTYGIYRRAQLQKLLQDPPPPSVEQPMAPIPQDTVSRHLIKLAKTDVPAALAEIENLYLDSDPEKRFAAIQTLPMLPETFDVTKYLAAAMEDSDPKIRLLAARYIGLRPDARSMQLVVRRLQHKDLSQGEKVELYGALARSENKQYQKNGFDWLVFTAKAGDAEANLRALTYAVRAAKNSPQLTKLLQEKLNSNVPSVKATAIMHLARTKDKKLMPELKKYSRDPSAEVRSAAAISAATACSKDRWDILNERLVKDTEPKVLRSLISASRILSSDQAIAFLNKAIASQKLDPDLVREAQKTLEWIKMNGVRDHCVNRR